MKTRLKAATAAAVLVFGLAQPSNAQVPVIDQMALQRWVSQLQHMVDQLNTMRSTFTAITGSRNLLSVFNTSADRLARTSAATLNDVIDGAITGNPIAGNATALTSALSQFRNTLELTSIDRFLASVHPQDRAIATQAGSGLAAMATAQDTYARADNAINRINSLVVAMDASPDLQATGAYTNVLLAEVATLLAENLRIQAAIANSLGASAAADARDGVAARDFLDIEP